jgi:hypothetical protein
LLFLFRYVCVLCKTKNDRDGTGPVEGRTFRVACGCYELLPTKSRAKFLKDCREWDGPGEEAPCHFDCPFQAISDYIMLIPDPFGVMQATRWMCHPEREREHVLKLMRARTTYPPRVFISANLGINQIRGAMGRINALLPVHMQVLILLSFYSLTRIYIYFLNLVRQYLWTHWSPHFCFYGH